MTLVGDTIRTARESYGAYLPSLRTFADRSGISAAQVSRIEAGLIDKPSLETLTSIAQALDRNPRFLWIVAGRLTGSEALSVLRSACRPGAELFDEWDDEDATAEAMRVVGQDAPSEDEMRLLAARIFSTFEVEETLWEGYANEVVGKTLEPRAKELLDLLRRLPPSSVEKVLEYARDQALATKQETTTAAIAAKGGVTMQGTELRPFSREWLEEQGFEGFVSVRELRETKCSAVPPVPGAYVVIIPEGATLRFLETSPGGHFKGKDPTVPVDRLESRWVENCGVPYIGKGNKLSRRLQEFVKFGGGAAIGHWGGRLVWQLAHSDDLIIAWRPSAPGVSAREQESELIAAFEEVFGCLPLANLTR
jgi:transcriptional regulator with XRE-family HTH domain